MPSGKKVGGVKSKRQGATPAASDAPPKKKVGGFKEGVRGYKAESSQMQSCPENCPGEYVEGMWIHSKNCPWASMLWAAHGKTEKDWACPYDCDPIEMPSGWTHPYDCPFWDRTGRTPIDHNPPPGVKHGKKNTRNRNRNRGSEVDQQQFLPVAKRAYDFTKFPDALRESGDDLPF